MRKHKALSMVSMTQKQADGHTALGKAGILSGGN